MDLPPLPQDIDADGIATFTWDMAGRSMNVIDVSVMDEIEAMIGEIGTSDAIKGVVITSGKEAFSGGADLSMLQALLGRSRPTRRDGRRGRGRSACSTRPAGSAGSTGGWKRSASRSSRRSTAPASAAPSNWRSPATPASSPTTTGSGSGFPRCGSG